MAGGRIPGGPATYSRGVRMRSSRRTGRWLAVAVVVTGCGTTETDPGSPLLDPAHPTWAEQAPATFQVRFETSQGVFAVEVHRDWAPIGADRFYNLVRNGFFDDARFHRVVEGFIVQFGLPGDPAVAVNWLDETIPDDPVKESNTRGRIAYAFTEPNTRATQVYISMADNSRLDTQGFSPFGELVEGMDVVSRIYSGYGEDAGGGVRRGDQSRIVAEGNAYLDREFPRLDRILTARIVRR